MAETNTTTPVTAETAEKTETAEAAEEVEAAEEAKTAETTETTETAEAAEEVEAAEEAETAETTETADDASAEESTVEEVTEEEIATTETANLASAAALNPFSGTNSINFNSGYKDYSNVDFDSSIDLANEWNYMIGSIGTQIPKASENQGFLTLKEAELDGGFPASFDAMIENVFTELLNLDRTMLTSLNELLAVDGAVEGTLPADDSVYPPAGDGPGGGDDGSGTGAGTVPPTTTEQLVENSKEQMQSYEKLSLSDLSAVASELVKLANYHSVTLDELLSNKTYDEDIQKALLESQHIPDDLKELILKGEVDISRKLLGNIFNGKETAIMGINENTILTLKQYLQSVSKEKGISYDQLFNSEQNSKVVKEALKSFTNVTSLINNMNPENATTDLMNIYDGNVSENVETSTINILKNHIQNVATSNNMDAETSIFSGKVSGDMDNLGRISILASNLSNFSDSTVLSVLKSLID